MRRQWVIERRCNVALYVQLFFFSSSRRHTRFSRDWSSDVCSSDLDSDPGRRSDPGPAFDWDLFLSHYAAVMGGAPVRPTPSSPAPASGLLAVDGWLGPEIGRASCRGRG